MSVSNDSWTRSAWCMWGIPWVHQGMFSTLGRYHEYIGDIMSTSGDVQYIGVFNRNWKVFTSLLPDMYHDITPMYWTSPDVLMISPDVLMVSPWCIHGIPLMHWTSPDVVMISPHMYHDIPQCTEHPPMYSWYPPMYWTPPNVLNIPQCTEHPPMYWTHIIQGE